MTIYDTAIVGGGPAGLTAALHLAWHGRPVVVIDRRTGPLFFTLDELHNVPGMPATRGVDIMRGLRSQAESLGAEIARGNVVGISGSDGDFLLTAELSSDETGTWQARTVLLATGVARYHPTVDGDHRPCFRYAGKGNLFYCFDCEAPEARDKETVVIGTGPGDWAAGTAIGLTLYTDRVRIVLTGGTEISDHRREQLTARGIDVVTGQISDLVGRTGRLEALELSDGTRVEGEAFFVSSPAVGRTDLAVSLGVEMAASGHHAQPLSQRGDTNVPGVWVAGDLRPMTQQVAVAMGTGNIAAVMIDQHLRRRDLDR